MLDWEEPNFAAMTLSPFLFAVNSVEHFCSAAVLLYECRKLPRSSYVAKVMNLIFYKFV